MPYLGSGSYGVEQASQIYFGKRTSELSLSEAAMIAGLFQAPDAYDPYSRPELAEERRNIVLSLLRISLPIHFAKHLGDTYMKEPIQTVKRHWLCFQNCLTIAT